MKPGPAIQKGWTAEDYLAWEREQPSRNEFVDGEIYAMTGGTFRHSLLASNLIAVLSSQLRARSCRVLGSDMRVAAPSGLFTYPDVVIVCGGPVFTSDRDDTLTNPSVIFEVLSESTEGYDRGKKFQHYQTIPSLAHYLLVSQDEPWIDHLRKLPSGDWVLTTHRAGDRITLESIHTSLDVDDAYLKVLEVAAN